MGIGQVVTLRFPAEKLREVNVAIEQSAWGAYRTEFYPTYDYRAIAEADHKVDEYLASIATCLPGKDEAMALRSLELWGQALANFHQVRHTDSEGSAAR